MSELAWLYLPIVINMPAALGILLAVWRCHKTSWESAMVLVAIILNLVWVHAFFYPPIKEQIPNEWLRIVYFAIAITLGWALGHLLRGLASRRTTVEGGT